MIGTLLSSVHGSSYDKYEPSGSNVFKTVVMALGMVGTSMAETLQQHSFSECFVGTADMDKTIDMSSIAIDTIRRTPCGLYYDYPVNSFRNTSMILNTRCLFDGGHSLSNPMDHCVNIVINNIDFCGKRFNLTNILPPSGNQAFTAELIWNYRNNNKFKEFSLYVFGNFLTSSNQNILFDQTFGAFIKTGVCPTLIQTNNE
jgi:hypothetical protein